MLDCRKFPWDHRVCECVCVCLCVFVCVCVCVCVWEGMCSGFNLWLLILMPCPPRSPIGWCSSSSPSPGEAELQRAGRPRPQRPDQQPDAVTPPAPATRPHTSWGQGAGPNVFTISLLWVTVNMKWHSTQTNSPNTVYWTVSVVQWWRLKTEDFQREFWTGQAKMKLMIWWLTEMFGFSLNLAVVEVVI